MMAEPAEEDPAATAQGNEGDAAPKAADRETADEAWAKAPEGSFMSPALGGALVLTGMLLRTVLFSGDSSPF